MCKLLCICDLLAAYLVGRFLLYDDTTCCMMIPPVAQHPHRKVSALSGQHCAAYLLQSDALRPALSLSETDTYTTPRLHTKFGERAFSFCGPASWNSLPAELLTISDTSVFKNKLKTHFFKLAFSIQ